MYLRRCKYMKFNIKRFLINKKTEEAVSDLRPKLLVGFCFCVAGALLFWVFGLACDAHVGFWYNLWRVLMHLCRGVGFALLIANVVLIVYQVAHHLRNEFSPDTKAFTAKPKPKDQRAPEPGDYAWKINPVDLSEFD